MRKRHEYALDLPDVEGRSQSVPVTRLELRPALPTDANALAELMFEAYRGTIDYDGEDLDDATREVNAYLASERGGQPLLTESRLAFDGNHLVGACLVAQWQERQTPLIAYIMTHAKWKNQGLGKQMLSAVLEALRQRGYEQVRAVITEGNRPSERLFGRMGFVRVDSVKPR